MDKETKELLTILILCLAIGFASVTTTLYLGGNVNITEDPADFNIKFTKAIVDGVDSSNSVISEDGKTISFQTKDLKQIGDKSLLEYTVTNNSSIYDADISVVCESDPSATNNSYYKITKIMVTSVIAKNTADGKVEVDLLKSTTKNITENFKCTLNATAKERTTRAS